VKPAYLRERRWFRGKARDLRETSVVERFPLDLAGTAAQLRVVRATYGDGGSEDYVVVGRDQDDQEEDALADPKLLSALLDHVRRETRVGALVFRKLPGFDEVKATSTTPMPSAKEQTNTSVPFGDTYILKIVRKLDDGRSAELEMGEFLTRNGYAGAPPVLGAIEIERPASAEPATVGIVHRFSPNRGEAWGFTLAILAADPAAYGRHATLLGRRVAEMHAVLARGTGSAFAPEPLDRSRRASLADAVRAAAGNVTRHIDEATRAKIDARVQAFVDLESDPVATRVHGDLHLGQILVTPPPQEDFVIIDFEGEPARPLEERKAKRSPMADVAGMLRSFDYAAATAKAPRAWYRATSEAFLSAYGDVLPLGGSRSASRDVLDFYLVEKCIYEIGYEANNRPDWIGIPLEGLRELLA
jgi:trehalose synthase-fused probable maltokinase